MYLTLSLHKNTFHASVMFMFNKNNCAKYIRSDVFLTYTKSNFMDLRKWTSPSDVLLDINKPYSDRKCTKFGIGLWYPNDWMKKFCDDSYGPNVTTLTIKGIANKHYFDMAAPKNLFMLKHGVKPSDGIQALLAGPTITECAAAIQITFYAYLLNLYGTDTFDRIFQSNVSQFIITNNLFASLSGTDKGKPLVGNPLYGLFDVIDGNSNTNMIDILEHGDVVYIKGVKKFDLKHLSGSCIGWNVIYIIVDGEKKFVGFGPDQFGPSGTLTISEIAKILIKGYNAPQDANTKAFIEKYYTNDLDLTDSMNATKAFVAANLSDDVVNLSNDIVKKIVGIEYILRPNKNKINQLPNLTMPTFEEMQFHPSTSLYVKPRMVVPYPSENKSSTFDNYQINDEWQRNLHNIMYKFAQLITCCDDRTPQGCILTGPAGIGKTHLTVALSRYASQRGKKVLYVDGMYFGDQLQKSRGEKIDFKDLLTNIDVVIIDDINQQYGTATQFFKDAIEYVFINNKALMVTSNTDVSIYDAIPYHVGFQDKVLQYFVVKNFSEINSHRQSWIPNCVNKLHELQNHSFNKSHHAIGTVLIHNNVVLNDSSKDHMRTTLLAIERQYMSTSIDVENIKPRIIDQPMKKQDKPWKTVYDLYVHGIEKYNLIIMYVDARDNDYIEQLLNVISKIYNIEAKLIVITDTLEKLQSSLWNEISKSENKDRLMDRINVVLPDILIK